LHNKPTAGFVLRIIPGPRDHRAAAPRIVAERSQEVQ
jgi:hypothetical protein